MAVPTGASVRHAKGTEGLVWPGNLYRVDTDPKLALGFRVQTADGRVFRYSHFGAATNRGVLVSQDISESSQADTDNVIVAPASAQTTSDGTAGSKFIEITLAGVTANQFAGGTFHTTDDTGEGYSYAIAGNTATDDPASGNFRLELQDPLAAAVAATTDFAIVGSLYSNLEPATSTDFAVSGIAMATMAAGEYGFVQTWGPATVLDDGGMTAGSIATLSDGTTGAAQDIGGGGTDAADLKTEPIIGYTLIAGDSGGHSVVFLQLNR